MNVGTEKMEMCHVAVNKFISFQTLSSCAQTLCCCNPTPALQSWKTVDKNLQPRLDSGALEILLPGTEPELS